ncbi:hypothetical protein ACFQV8_15525 [Pseudonocardia benzenivorans]
MELRVHGVAGTPPELMLQLVPAVRTDRAEQPPDDDDGAITEWRQPPARPQLRAWSWGSLTSGRWYQAFYLVLLPFMLANLAGWALLASPDGGPPTGTDDHADRERPARGVRIRWCVLLVRLAALLVTTIFAFWTQLVVADLVAYQWLVRHAGWPGWTVGAGFAVTAGVLLAVVWLSRIRTRPTRRHVDPWAVWTDPAGRASLHHDQPPMWNSPGINVGLRRLHLSAALGAVALAGCWPSAGGWTTWRTAGLWCAVATLAAVAVLTCWISLADGEGPGSADPAGPPRALRGHGLPPVALVRHGTWPPAAAALALAAVATGGVDTAWVGAHPFLPALRGSALWLSLAVLVVAALVGVVQGRVVPAPGTPPRRRDLRRANAPSILLLAAAIGPRWGRASPSRWPGSPGRRAVWARAWSSATPSAGWRSCSPRSSRPSAWSSRCAGSRCGSSRGPTAVDPGRGRVALVDRPRLVADGAARRARLAGHRRRDRRRAGPRRAPR